MICFLNGAQPCLFILHPRQRLGKFQRLVCLGELFYKRLNLGGGDFIFLQGCRNVRGGFDILIDGLELCNYGGVLAAGFGVGAIIATADHAYDRHADRTRKNKPALHAASLSPDRAGAIASWSQTVTID